MPHINRIRVNNVKYNFGTQYYDDFVMRFDGKNVLYDLANGGGKSVLLLLLLQNLIPNCTLDDKQPVEKLFRGEGGSTVIHSMIEWKLDDYLIKDDYRYMLTGFCARKAKDEEGNSSGAGDTASIEYFNYIIFYRHYNDHDIVNFPLNNGKERVTFPGLKSYLKNLSKKDTQLKVQVFERKGEYQQMISRFGLYESEWEIIRGINKTEGHVRAYFEGHYKTTRKVVEDLLIENLIQKAFSMRTASDHTGNVQNMADTLEQIRGQLTELIRKRQEINHYDHQKEILLGLAGQIQALEQLYDGEQTLYQDMAKTWRTAVYRNQHVKDQLERMAADKQKMSQQILELKRRLETIKIQAGQEELAGLEAMTEDLRQQLQIIKNNQIDLRERLNLQQSMNDYLEYMDYQEKYHAISEAIHHAAAGEKELADMLYQYAGSWYSRYTVQKNALQTQLAKLLEDAQKIKSDMEQSALQEREADRMIAVLDHQLHADCQTEEALLKQFAVYRDQSGMMLLEEADAVIENNRQIIDRLEEKQLKQQHTLEQWKKEEQKLILLKETTDAKKNVLIEQKKQAESFLKEWTEKNIEIEQRMKVYQTTSVKQLKHVLQKHYEANICAINEKNQQLAEIAIRYEAIKKRQLYAVSQQMDQCFLQLAEKGVHCEAGAQWILSVSKPKEIFSDSKMHKEELQKNDRMIFAGSYLSERDEQETMLFAQKQLAQEEAELTGVIRNLKEQAEIIWEDLIYVIHFLMTYDHQKEDYDQLLENCIQEIENADRLMIAAQKDYSVLVEKQQAMEQTIQTDRLLYEQTKEKLDNLLQLKATSQQIDALHEKMRAGQNDLSHWNQKKNEAGQTMTSLQIAIEDCNAKQKQLHHNIEQLVSDWQMNWQLYYDPSFELQENTLSDDALKAAFSGAKEAYERKNMDLADKQQLLDSYHKTMERLLKSIEDRHQDVTHLAQMAQKGMLYMTSEENITKMREELKQLFALEEAHSQKLSVLDADKHQLYGSVKQAVAAVTEKYGSYEAVSLNEQSCEQYMQQITIELDQIAAAYGKTIQQIEQLTRQQYISEGLMGDLSRMLKNYQIPLVDHGDYYDDQMDLKMHYGRLHQQTEQLKKQYYNKKEQFEQEKQKVIRVLSETGANELAVELQTYMVMPEGREQAIEALNNMHEMVMLIDLEKEQIEKNMTGLLSVREKFEDQCIQICLNIKHELEKLPKMSRIMMDGEQIQMLGLSIPYIKENFYRQQMSAYIDEIVTTSETYTTTEERIQYIRRQLEWKRLFAVIVHDMNAIRLTLYKRERIREQSRYLRYEEAVGSTGQSQGIYIQFLIAIIHYISCIHAGTAVNESVKKVLFIDNPFGAAKDLYIWEPIFALLKTNDVQLIVPARGATPAITGRFDVNYVLGQKVMSKHQQTIIVDYHSNVNIDELEYVKMDYKQEVFDFV